MFRFAPGAALGLALLAASPSSAATTWVVTPDGTGDFVDLAAAIAGATAGDVIELTDGVFTGDGNRNLYVNGQELTIRSQSGNREACVLDPDGGTDLLRRAFAFQGAGPTFVLQDLTFRNGSALGTGEVYGGAIQLSNNCSPTVTNCVFQGNAAERGGAIFGYDNCSPAISDCAFVGNVALSYGGGISLNAGCAPSISNCLFLENTSDYTGGALNLWNGAAPVITNCTFYANSAPDGGAAAWCRYGGAPAFVNTIIAGSLSGDAISCSLGDGAPTLTCCDVYGNAGGDWVDCIAGMETSNDNMSGDPLFCDAVSGDFRLQDSSACLEANCPCGQVGLVGLGSCLTQAVDASSWGRVKQRYR